MKIDALLPMSDLPKTGRPVSSEEQWLPFEKEKFRQAGGHPTYGEGDVSYRYNSRGYRCPELTDNADIRLISIGDSNTFGVGLPQARIYHEQFAKRLRSTLFRSVINWNLGLFGASNDYISRVLHLAVPLLNPHIVLVLFTFCSRREYMDVEGRHWNYVPSQVNPHPISREIFSHLSALSSSYDDELNFFRNYKSVEALLSDRIWLYCACSSDDVDSISDFVNHRRYVGRFQKIDTARDGCHYGPDTHAVICKLMWDRFVEIGGLDDLP